MENQHQGKPTRLGQYISRVVTINMILLIVGVIYTNIARHQQIQEIRDDATIAKAKAEALEQQLLDYMERTVQRWDALSELNRNLNVPTAIEPQPPGKRDLTAAELKRPAYRTPTPTATPRPKMRTVIKYKPRPKPTPWRLFNW